jgi:hypothetical protein
MTRRLAIIGLVIAIAPSRFRAQDLSVPNRPDSLKFAAIVDHVAMEDEEARVATRVVELFFQVISRTGQTVDGGVIHRGAAR